MQRFRKRAAVHAASLAEDRPNVVTGRATDQQNDEPRMRPEKALR